MSAAILIVVNFMVLVLSRLDIKNNKTTPTTIKPLPFPQVKSQTVGWSGGGPAVGEVGPGKRRRAQLGPV